MTLDVPHWTAEIAADLPYPLVFATVSGAHLYGFASVDSDLDVRACHLLSAAEVVGLHTGPETLQTGGVRDGVELDVVSHDLLKFARLLTNRNGYVLEQLFSPLVVATGDTHAELLALAPGLITRHHAHHYLGFAATQEKLFARTGRLKPALYALRVLLTGIHLMRTGEVEANLNRLDPPAYVPDLIAAKRAAEHGQFPDGASGEHGRAPAGAESGHGFLPDDFSPDDARGRRSRARAEGGHDCFTGVARSELDRDLSALRAELAAARDASALPDRPDPAALAALHDLVVRTRLR